MNEDGLDSADEPAPTAARLGDPDVAWVDATVVCDADDAHRTRMFLATPNADAAAARREPRPCMAATATSFHLFYGQAEGVRTYRFSRVGDGDDDGDDDDDDDDGDDDDAWRGGVILEQFYAMPSCTPVSSAHTSHTQSNST